MNAVARITVAAALGVLSFACSSDANRAAGAGTGGTGGTGGGPTGDGGSVGTGGGGAGGLGGVAGAGIPRTDPADSLALPGCLKDLLAACPPQGTCVATPADAAGSAFCFASGVRVTLTYRPISTLCNDSSVDVVTVSKPDGTPCYSYETFIDQGLGCEHSTHTWRDAAGNVVATGRRSLVFGNSVGITCMASGERTACEGRDGCCNVSQFGGATCEVGVPSVACTQGSCPGGSGGAGGAVGTGGVGGLGGVAGGSAGTGGVGGTGGGAADLELPDCVKDLIASCATDGACTVPVMDGGPETEVCFDSGVHGTFGTVDDTSSCGGRRVVQVTRADGSPCYSYEKYVSNGTACEGTVYTWKDAAGQVVATGTGNLFSNPTHQITCANGGQKKTCHNPIITTNTGACCGIAELGDAGCGPPPIVHGRCRYGTCP